MRKAFSLNKGERLLVALLVCFGLLQIAGYWFAGAMVNGDGPLAIPQPDAALYLQSAVRVATGHPFSFSEGAAVSTGSTTVLHPFLFSIPVLLGVKGFALVSVFFWMNAALYLLFLFGWCAVIWRHVGDFRVRFFACVLLVLFPQPAYVAMAMSDIGLWLGFSGLFAAALAYDRRCLYGSLLVMAPWIRPEGMVLVIAFVMVMAGVAMFARPKFRRSDAMIAALGVASLSGVFALNYALVGFCQFSSVLHKGHFVNAPFSVALSCSVNDLLSIARAFFFGQTVSMPRNYYMIPVVGGLMFWIGAFVHDWRGEGRWRKYVLPLAMAGGVWTVATSGWQNTNADRYLAWIMPMIVILMAEGFAFVAGRLRSCTAGMILLAFPLLFAAGTSVAFWSLYNSAEDYKVTDAEPTADNLKSLHKLIKKVTGDIENFSYNTAISAFMIAVGELQQQKCTSRAILSPLAVLIAPFAPHIAEELWHQLGNTTTVCDAEWPKFEEKYLVESTIKYPVQIGGKMRFTIDLPADMTPADVQATVLAHPDAQKWINGATPKKVIVVPKKIVNVVL